MDYKITYLVETSPNDLWYEASCWKKKFPTDYLPIPTHVDGIESVNTGCGVWQEFFC